MQRNVKHKMKIFIHFVLVLFLSFNVSAQPPGSEHQSHHPNIAGNGAQLNLDALQSGIFDANSLPAKGKGPNSAMGKGQGMDGMMKKMGAPKPKDLYPSLMRLSELTEDMRSEVQLKAANRMQTGSVVMAEGFDSLLNADSRQDFSQMQSAVFTIEQGLSQYNSGLAAKRALVEGQAPRRVALQWFKREMNLLPTVSSESSSRFLGMTPLHTSIMFVFIVFAVIMIWMYVFKMRRAGSLMEELKQQSLSEAIVSPKEASDAPTVPVLSDSESHSSFVKPKYYRQDPTENSKATHFKGLMRVVGIFNETHDVKTFRLAQPNGNQLPFGYEPGQFVTFSLSIPGQEKKTKRSYTIASSPSQRDYMEVTIKREEHGLVSRYMHDSVEIDDLLEIKAPNGQFYFNGIASNSIVLISGGVGITPMMSAVRYLTAQCWQGDIYFIFSARTTHDFIFEQELHYLQRRHSNLHVLVSMTRAEGTTWMGPQGRLTPELINGFVPSLASKVAHICGPPAMMEAITETLVKLGVPKNNIKTEAFGNTTKRKIPTPDTPLTDSLIFDVEFANSGKHGKSKPGETILEVAETIDVDIDSSCRAGTCGTCKVKLISGEVHMEVDEGLEVDDKNAGYILACQGVPSSNVKVEA